MTCLFSVVYMRKKTLLIWRRKGKEKWWNFNKYLFSGQLTGSSRQSDNRQSAVIVRNQRIYSWY